MATNLNGNSQLLINKKRPIKYHQNNIIKKIDPNMLPQDQLKLIGCLLMSVPLSYAMSYIHKPAFLLMFTCTISIIMQMIVFRQQIILLWIQQNIVYFLCKFGPRKIIGKVIMIQSFAILTVIQIFRMYMSYGQENVDITAIFMMQVFQYIGFSFNYQDGLEEKKSQYTITQLPSYVQYMGYVLFIPSCLVGPVFQYKDFQSYLYRTGIYKDIIGGCTTPGMKKQLKTTLMSIAVFITLSPFPCSKMISPQFNNWNFLIKSAYMMVSIVGVRFKYYTAWSLGMVSMNATGITSNPKLDQHSRIVNNWDRVRVSNIWDFQMDPSMKKKADGWNIPIQMALKRYIYDRIYIPSQSHTPKQKKAIQIQAQQKTLAVSALWHGLYLGYFVAFFHWALLLQVSQQLFRIEKQSSTLRKWRKKLHYVELIFINYFLGFFGVCFQLMTKEKISIYLSNFYFVPVIITYILNLVLVRMGLFHKKSSRSKPMHSQAQKQEKSS